MQISNDARTGNSAVKLCDPLSEIQQIIPTQPGILYEVAISGKPENGNSNTFYKFRALDANWQPLIVAGNLRDYIAADFITQSNPPGSYYDKRWFFTTPPNAKWLQVVVWNQEEGCIVIDDIEICEKEGGCNNDIEPPIISDCPPDITSEPNWPNNGFVFLPNPLATDNCGIPIMSRDNNITTFPIGTTQVTYTATDDSNNSSTCSFSVTVIPQNSSGDCNNDTEPPVISNCPTDINSVASGQSNGLAGWAEPTATDNCGTPTLTSNRSSGTYFAFGTTEVIYTATDDSNNTSTCSFNVTITPQPTPSGPGDLVLSRVSPANVYIPQWSTGEVVFVLKNEGIGDLEDVEVTFTLSDNVRLVGGNEFDIQPAVQGVTLEKVWTRNPVWKIGNFAGSDPRIPGFGNLITIQFNVYSITNEPMYIYGEVTNATGDELDSTPGNGIVPTPNEDDEAVININGGTAPPPPPSGEADLTVLNLELENSTINSGEELNYNFDIVNAGFANVPQDFVIRAYLSTDEVLSSDDVQDGVVPTGNFDAGLFVRDVAGASTVNLPEGEYYLILKVDGDDEVAESDEENNVVVSNQFRVEDRMTNPSCNVQFTGAGSRIGCIQEAFGNMELNYDSAGYQITKVYSSDLKLLNVQTLLEQIEPKLEWIGSILTKTNEDQTIVFRRTIPLNITSRLTLLRRVIEFGNGFVFFGWEDKDLSNSTSAGDEYIAIRTDNDFNIVAQNKVDEFRSTFASREFVNISEANNSNILLQVRTLANSNMTNQIFVLDESLELVDVEPFGGGLTAGSGYWKNVCNNYTYSTSSTPFCGTGFCTSNTGGNFSLKEDSVFYENSFYEFSNQFSSGGGTRQSNIEHQTKDGGKIISEKMITFGGQFPLNDDSRTFLKFDSNGNLRWEKTYLIPDAISIRRVFELNNEIFIIDGTTISRLDCYAQTAPPSTGVDLELSIASPVPTNPLQWSFFNTTITLTNNGTAPATGIEVKLERPDEAVYKGGDEFNSSQGDFQHWGDEIWRVGDLAAGQSATISINYYRLSANGFSLYAQVGNLNETDSDSTPGNGNCCTANEDDEAVIQIGTSANSVGNRASVAEHLGNEVFAIVGANPNPTTGRFNVEVYSNENQNSEMTIVDILGRPIFRKEVILNEGHNTIPIELENGGAGMMVVKMTPFHSYLRQIRVMKVRD